ncbi:MAG: type II toxin-antitoxin system RelE/ParE family toxin [Caldimonas sp.]
MSETAELQFTFLACDDLAGIWDSVASPIGLYGTREAGDTEATQAFVRDFITHCELLTANSELGRNLDDLVFGVRSSAFQKYSVFYRVRGSSIVVLRVLRSSRDLAIPA